MRSQQAAPVMLRAFSTSSPVFSPPPFGQPPLLQTSNSMPYLQANAQSAPVRARPACSQTALCRQAAAAAAPCRCASQPHCRPEHVSWERDHASYLLWTVHPQALPSSALLCNSMHRLGLLHSRPARQWDDLTFQALGRSVCRCRCSTTAPAFAPSPTNLAMYSDVRQQVK